MLQLAFIRQNAPLVKERLAIKNFTGLELVDEIIQIDDQRKKLQLESDTTQSKLNSISKEIGQLMGTGQKEQAENKKKEVASLKSSLQPIAEQLQKIELKLNEALISLPNLPAKTVPPGKTPSDNITVREGGNKPKLHAGAVPHWDLAKKYNLIDFELGNKITGSGFPVYINKGVKLHRSFV